MVLEGVIVYGNDMKVGGVKIICGCYTTALEKVISLSPPHRIWHIPSQINRIANHINIPYNLYYVK